MKMFKTFEEAYDKAFEIIMSNRYYEIADSCVVTETKNCKKSRTSVFNFRFNDTDTEGKCIKLNDGHYEKKTLIWKK